MGRRKVGFLRGQGFALGLPSKGRWFTLPALVASGYGLFDPRPVGAAYLFMCIGCPNRLPRPSAWPADG